MLIDDERAFSLLIPNMGGGAFLRRSLDYLQSIEYAGHILIADSSEGETLTFVQNCPRLYPALWLTVKTYPAAIRFLDKVTAALRELDSEFVLLHANDDFMVLHEVNRCVEVMAGDSGLSAARGRIALFAFEHGAGKEGAKPGVSLLPYPMRGYDHADPIERMLDLIGHYTATFYCVHRRQGLIENFETTEAGTKNIVFFQYLSGALLALQGRIWCGDRLFYARQGHGRSMSAVLRRGDYEHWPLLITSPQFSRYYGEFRDAICRWAQEKLGAPADGLAQRIDRVSAERLFDRGYCRREPASPEELAFLGQLKDTDAPDHRELRRFIDFCSAHPDTL